MFLASFLVVSLSDSNFPLHYWSSANSAGRTHFFCSDFIILAICTVLEILEKAATVVTLPSSCCLDLKEFKGIYSIYKIIHLLHSDGHLIS